MFNQPKKLSKKQKAKNRKQKTERNEQHMYNLSELIKTDCYIDCGTNEKLREVVGKLKIPESIGQCWVGVNDKDLFLVIVFGSYTTHTIKFPDTIPLTSINIDL